MIDLTAGDIVSAVVGFAFVQRDTFGDVEENDLSFSTLIAKPLALF